MIRPFKKYIHCGRFKIREVRYGHDFEFFKLLKPHKIEHFVIISPCVSSKKAFTTKFFVYSLFIFHHNFLWGCRMTLIFCSICSSDLEDYFRYLCYVFLTSRKFLTVSRSWNLSKQCFLNLKTSCNYQTRCIAFYEALTIWKIQNRARSVPVAF